ncbi:hypothetical protein KA025_01955 [Candidatus Saccharibacteria bacterium]|nr:hypothetical protein [Candidatus Saccharibacteria bacterium]
MKYFKLNKAGDTIVEVLIVVTVLAITLSGAYTIASRSTSGVQANKERYQAQLIANGQVERIRSNIAIITNRNAYNAWTSSSPGCIYMTGASITGLVNCTTNDGVIFDGNGLYQVRLECVAGCLSSDTYSTYKIRVEWDSINSDNASGKDNVELYYGA